MNNKKYYVYEWFNIDTSEVFYVGKGCRDRYKSLNHRNKSFLKYYNNNNVDVRIVKYFDNEDEAYLYEKNLTEKYRNIGQCQCCLIDGGYGGYSSIWSEEARQYKSKYNPMKNEKQRKRMSINNPMKNKDVVDKVSAKRKKAIMVGDIYFNGLVDVAKEYDVAPTTINYWLNNGYTNDGKPIYYYGKEKPIVNIKSNNTSSKGIYIDGIYFKSLTDGGKYLNCHISTISHALRNNEGKYKNHKIEYANTPDKKAV